MLDVPQRSPTVPDESVDAALERLAAELGPFSPDPDFSHGGEFIPAPPRPIPARLRQGSYARRRRTALVSLAVLGGACLIFAPLHFVRELGFYILVFHYLHWIGLVLLLFAAGIFIQQRFDAGDYRYVREGIPFVGRVLDVDLAMSGIADAPHFGYAVALEYIHPETGRRQTGVVVSEPLALAAQAELFEPAVTPGDYVTLVGLPGRIEKTVRVYGFLGLDPDRELIRKNGEPRQGMSVRRVLLLVCACLGALLLVTAALASLWFYLPIDGDWRVAVVPIAAGAVLGGVAAVVIGRSGELPSGWFDRWVGYVGGALIGAVGGFFALSIFNAVLDDSPAEYRPVEVVEYWQITHYPLFVREYEIEFRELGDQERHKHPARVSEMERFRESNLGVMEIGRGAFELPWVRRLHPLRWIPAELAPENVERFLVKTEDGDVVAIAPAIELGDGKRMPPPDGLVARARQQIAPFLAESDE